MGINCKDIFGVKSVLFILNWNPGALECINLPGGNCVTFGGGVINFIKAKMDAAFLDLLVRTKGASQALALPSLSLSLRVFQCW